MGAHPDKKFTAEIAETAEGNRGKTDLLLFSATSALSAVKL
jgi:hypothetical protein